MTRQMQDVRKAPLSVLRILVVSVLGLLLGSFANVVVYRLPKGESLIRPRSHCTSCARVLTGYENIPVLSWVVQKGRCRGCGIGISVRYPLTELIVALGFACSLWLVGFQWALIYVLIGDFVAIVASEIDLEVRKIPNRLLISGLALSFGAMIMQILLAGQTHLLERFFIAMMASSGVLYAIALISRGGMGMGDVKMVGLLGAITGVLGYPYVFMMVLGSFAFGSMFGIMLILKKKANRKSAVPFGPFIGGGYLLGQLTYHFTPHLFGL